MLKKIVFAFFMLNLSFAQAAEDNPKESAGPKKIVTACFACTSFFAPTLKEKHEKTKCHLKKLSQLTEDTLLFKDVEIEITKNKTCPRCGIVFAYPGNLALHTVFKPDCTEEPAPAAVPCKHKPSYPDQPGITNTLEDGLPNDLKRKIAAFSKIGSVGRPKSTLPLAASKLTENKKCHHCGVVFSYPEQLITHTLFKPFYCTGEPAPYKFSYPDQPEITNTPEDRLPDDLKRKILALSKMGSLGRATSEHQQKRKKSEELDPWISAQPTFIENPPLLFDFNLQDPLALPILPADFLGTNPFSDALPTPLFDFEQPDCMAAQPSSTENQPLSVVDLNSTDPLYLPEPFDPDQNFFE